MKMTTASAVALATLALLGACGPKGGAANGAAAGGAPGAAAPTSGPDVQVDPSSMPRQRGGLWKTVLDNGDGKPDTSTNCMSGKVPAIPKMPEGCKQLSVKRTFLGAYVMDMSCATPAYSAVMHAVVSGDFQTHMTGDSTMTMTMSQQPPRVMKMHTDATWVGPCAPGQKPIDDEDSNATG
jgi:Protein of unknown function (DUF3617)